MALTERENGAVAAMRVGLGLTVVAAIVPYVDRATTHVLADHIRAGYPAYSAAEIGSAVTAYTVLLSVVGVLGAVGWLVTTWLVRARKRWSLPAAAVMLVLGASVALGALLTKDTSGDTGLAPALGWVGLAPCVAGVVAVALLVPRRRTL